VRSNAQARPTRNTDAWGTHCSPLGHPPPTAHLWATRQVVEKLEREVRDRA